MNPPKARLSWPAALVGLALILAFLAAFVFYRLETWPERMASRARDAFVSLTRLQPKVTIDEHVVFEQTHDVLELAVAEQEVSVERTAEDTWLGSTKRLRVRGDYRVKAGYDLTRPVDVSVESADHRIRLRMPPPKILSVELLRLEVLTQDSGLWNPVQPQDFQNETNALTLDARGKAQENGLPREAAERFSRQFAEKLGPGYQIEIGSNAGLPARTPRP
jgi:hypothetical protein